MYCPIIEEATHYFNISATTTMNSTEVQKPRRKLDENCLWLSYVFGSVFVCAKSAHVSEALTRFADFVSN